MAKIKIFKNKKYKSKVADTIRNILIQIDHPSFQRMEKEKTFIILRL